MATADSMVPTGPSSSGQQAVIAYLQSKGLPVNAGNIRRAIEANAREPGDPSANGPDLGPVVLNLRNAGIEDASPMPQRGSGGGGGRTSAPPAATTQPSPDKTVEPSLPSDRSGGVSIPPPFIGMGPQNPPGIPVVNEALPPQLAGPRAAPMLSGPPGAPMLPSPTNLPAIEGGAAAPALGGSAALPALAALIPAILGGRSLSQLLQGPGATPQLSGPGAIPQVGGPAALPQLEGPVAPAQVGGPRPGAAQLPAPAERAPIALPSEGTGRPAIPLPTPGVARPALETPGVQLNPATAPVPQTPAGDAVSKAVGDDAPAPRAKTKTRARAKFKAP